MGRYVDGFLLPVPTSRVEDYRKMAELGRQVWLEHGALEYVECVAEDVPDGEVTSFPRAVKLEDGETMVFAWIVYKSREDRDRVNAAVMEDPRMNNYDLATMPFDGKRMMWGGFTELVSSV